MKNSWLTVALLLSAGCAAAQVAPPSENTGANASIARAASGSYAYRAKDGRERGEERFQLVVHPDGSRTLLMWHDLFARNAQFTVTLRVAADYRPLEAYATYWNAGAYKGATLFRVDGDRLSASYRGPAGQQDQTIAVPALFSLGTHPVAGDGWHVARLDPAARGPQVLQLASVEASTDLTKPMLVTLVPLQAERIGAERITVPAGSFDTTHYRLAGVNDIWVLDQDLIVVRSVSTARGLEYELTSLTRTAGHL